MKIVKQLCLQRKISFVDMASELDIPRAYAVLACVKNLLKKRGEITDYKLFTG